MSKEHSLQQVLELACAAQRFNNEYIKETTPVYSDDGKIMSFKWANKMLMLTTLYPENYMPSYDQGFLPPLLRPSKEDIALSQDISKYFRKLMFAAVTGENEFQSKVNSLLEKEFINANEFGYIACLPSFYARDYAQTQIKKRVKSISDEYLGAIGSNLLDKDCEILESTRSQNYDAWNISAIIDNRLVSWLSKQNLAIGPAVVIKAKVKDHSKHWKHGTSVTRLNYVKVAQ